MVSVSETLRDADARPDAAPDSDAEAGRVIEIVRPERQTLPVVFASPHSGTDYPESFIAALQARRGGAAQVRGQLHRRDLGRRAAATARR